MKTIILTSAGFGTPALQQDLLGGLSKKPSELKVAYVTTAAKVEESKDFVERDKRVLSDLGFPLEEVDIEGQSRATLAKLLGGKDIIFVQGGNTFIACPTIEMATWKKHDRNRGPLKMTLSDYLKDIGVTYLLIPVIPVGFGYLL